MNNFNITTSDSDKKLISLAESFLDYDKQLDWTASEGLWKIEYLNESSSKEAAILANICSVRKVKNQTSSNIRIDLVVDKDFLISSAFATVLGREIRIPIFLDFKEFNSSEMAKRLEITLSKELNAKKEQYKFSKSKI